MELLSRCRDQLCRDASDKSTAACAGGDRLRGSAQSYSVPYPRPDPALAEAVRQTGKPDAVRGLGCIPEASTSHRRDGGDMTMYLPNDDVRPTGNEPAEFIEPEIVTPTGDERPEPHPDPTEVGDEDGATSAR